MPSDGDHFMFSFMNGSANLAGQCSEVRTSDRIRQDVEEGEEHCSDLQGETDEPDAAVQQQERDELEAKRDFWSVSGSLTDRHVCRRKARFLSHSSTLTLSDGHTTLDVLPECQIDLWNVDGDRILSGQWTSFTQFAQF